jgi:N-acetylneuraminate epimerase
MSTIFRGLFQRKFHQVFIKPKKIGLAGAAIGVSGQLLMVGGGTNFPVKMPWKGGKKNYYDAIFLYDKTDEGLVLRPNTKLKLPFRLAYAAVCSTPNGVVIAGGENENGLIKKVLLLNWIDERLSMRYLPELPQGVTNAALTVIGNTLYLAGGETENGATDQFLSLDLNTQPTAWKVLVHLPKPVSHTVLLSANNELYLIGGRKRNLGDTSTLYNGMHTFNISEQVWTTKKAMPYPISAASGIINKKSILVFSGDRGETFHEVEGLIAAIDREGDVKKKEVLNKQKIKLQASHPGFSKAVLKYDLVSNVWTTLKNPMPYGTVTTTAVVLANEVIIAGGEIKAGVRTPNIMVGKLKYLK